MFAAGPSAGIERNEMERQGHLPAPVAIIGGDRDPYCPHGSPIAEELVGIILHAIIEGHGANHFVMEERPVQVWAALERLPERSASSHLHG